jgi:hypothetical protein
MAGVARAVVSVTQVAELELRVRALEEQRGIREPA